MRGALAIVAALVLLMAAPAAPTQAQAAPFCRPGQSPQFVLGFAELRRQVGPAMGEPVECEHPDPATGDSLQKTTTGLAFFRASTNTPTFTDGWRHWALTAAGLVYWEGTSVDPPATAVPVAPSPTTPSPSPDRSLRSFVDGIAGQLNQYWDERFARDGKEYQRPTAVHWITDTRNPSGCGPGFALTPFYCRRDGSIGLPSRFFERYWPQPDAAIVVVIAHEWGHHTQQQLGMFRGQYRNIQTEQQADCFAGEFFAHAASQGWLDDGDVEEATEMARMGGDSRGEQDPRAHGSPSQRAEAFTTGYGVGGESCWAFTATER